MISDPSQFLQRVIEEALSQSGHSGDGHVGTGAIDNDAFLAHALGERLAALFNSQAESQEDAESQEELASSWTDSPALSPILDHYEELLERNSHLAAALGACECWGDVADCEMCGGEGTPGWCPPDRRLFARFVRPAVRALPQPPTKAIHPSVGNNAGRMRSDYNM